MGPRFQSLASRFHLSISTSNVDEISENLKKKIFFVTTTPATQSSTAFFHLLLFEFRAGQLRTMQQLLQRHRRLLGSDPSSPSVNGSRSDNTPEFVGAATFDTNMMIILAALLFAILGALGVNSILRCALRCCRSFTVEGEEGAEEREAAAALKKRELGRIPVVVYGGRGSIKGTECPICLSEFEDGDKVRILPQCHHGFHASCIDTWFVSHSSCPNCRHSLLEPLATDPDLDRRQPDGSGSIRQPTSSLLVIEEMG